MKSEINVGMVVCVCVWPITLCELIGRHVTVRDQAAYTAVTLLFQGTLSTLLLSRSEKRNWNIAAIISILCLFLHLFNRGPPSLCQS